MQQVIIVLADTTEQAEKNEEFIELVQATDMEIKETFTQNLKSITLRTYIGIGKCEEIRAYLQEQEIQRVVFNHDLSPLQIRNLEEILQTPVMDRTELILAIFESRAVTRTARLQIECAQLKKLFPRLIGANTQLGRQSGSGKNKGAGEKQLELDRRRINARIQELQRELKKIEAQRFNQRRARQKSMLPLVSLVGYTNAGKSTIMNMLLEHSSPYEEDKKVLEKDMLFATLDTSIRHIDLPDGKSFLLSDTVGFVSDLPHDLVEAFHSTLEEVQYASLLVQVVDVSSEEYARQMEITQETLQQIKAADIPMITVYNKCDQSGYQYPQVHAHDLYISAKEKAGLQELLDLIHSHLYPDEKHVELHIPYQQTGIYSLLMKHAHVISRRDEEDGIHLDAVLSDTLYQKYRNYVICLKEEG